MEKQPRYWFPAKRYGWGWGAPCTWQGWVIFVVWLAAFSALFPLVLLRHRPLEQVVFPLLMIGLLVVVCYWKGEPPRWRWGE